MYEDSLPALWKCFFDIYSEYLVHLPQYRFIQEVVRDGVFMYRHDKLDTVSQNLLKQWFEYAYFTTAQLRALHFPSFYVYRCMHHISNKTVIRHDLPFSTTWNLEIALDWRTKHSTILMFDVSHLLLTYIPSNEDELVIEPCFITKLQKIPYIDEDIDLVLCVCIPLRSY